MLLLRDVKSSKKGSRFETRPTRYNIGAALKSLHAEFTAHIPLELFRCPYPCGRPVQAFQSIGVTGLKVKHIVPSSHGHFDRTLGVILATHIAEVFMAPVRFQRYRLILASNRIDESCTVD